MNTRLNGEDDYSATRRGENTSRLESKFESSAMEGLHAEDHPELVKTIKTAQEGAAMQQEAAEREHTEWLAARPDGGVDVHSGEVDIKKIVPQREDNEIDALRKLRLAQMKGRAAELSSWLAKGHGAYVKLEQESSFLDAMQKHERAVCALCEHGSIDGELLHAHMRALAPVHVETYFCWLDPADAPLMMEMVDVGRLPALLLAKGGQVVQHLNGLDRSFTAEGVAYELGEHGLCDFEEGQAYGSAGNACTTASAQRTAMRMGMARDDDSDLDDSEEEDIDE